MPRIHYSLDVFRARPELEMVSGAKNLARLLIVDSDSGGYAATLLRAFNRRQVAEQPNRGRAAEILLKIAFDLVLLEHSRREPCYELLHWIKAVRPTTPVIILTAEGSEEVAVRAFRCGARDYFIKPVAPDELEISIRSICAFQENPCLEGGGMEKALAYINLHFASPLALDQVAMVAGMSVSSFVRNFKKRTGVTFNWYLNGLRIAKAQRLLADGRLTLLKIAFTCGFNNQTHFNRTFKKFTGQSPGVCR